jgi:glutamate formiminotransferase
MTSSRAKSILCIVYVSEARNIAAIKHLNSISKTHLLHSFSDTTYNRTSFYFTGSNEEILSPVVEFCTQAFDSIDFSVHNGTHPTLGAIDHISLSPIGDETMQNTVTAARCIAQQLYECKSVPIYYYGALSPTNARLQDIRRSLNYFSSSSSSRPLESLSTSTSHYRA